MVTPIENAADSFNEGAHTSFALIALGASLSATETANVGLVYFAILRALRIPTEGARMSEVWWFRSGQKSPFHSLMLQLLYINTRGVDYPILPSEKILTDHYNTKPTLLQPFVYFRD